MTDRTLHVMQQAPDEGACCAACASTAAASTAAASTAPATTAGTTADLEPTVLVPARRPMSRTDDRRITFAGLLVSAGLLGLAIMSLALPEGARRGLWLPLHLGLAGAAGTAVASVLPFFTTALAVAPPARRAIRLAAIGLIALGSLAVSGGVVSGVPAIAVTGGLAYLVGLAALAVAAFGTLRGALGPQRRLVRTAYAAALVQVGVGVVTATSMLAGFGPVIERWGLLKPAHAWLNVFGFLSLIVAATLVHLAPTVVGARIQARRSATVAIVCLAVGAPVIATGFALGVDVVARLGVLAEVIGASSLVGHALTVSRGHGRWTTDPGWHRLTSWSLLAAPCWLLVAVAIAGTRILWLGADPAAWSLGDVAAPLALGWVAQVLIGAWSHLLPAIGPGDGGAHARARTVLGRAATVRVVTFNLGVGLLVIGGSLTWTPAILLGMALAIATSLAAVATFFMAVSASRSTGLTPASSARI